jgi:hypothetical protein
MKMRVFSMAAMALLGSSALAQKIPVTDVTRDGSAAVKPQQIHVTDFTQDGSSAVKDPDAPVSFQLPQGWKLLGGTRWGDHETTLQLVDAESGIMVALYYQYPLQKPYKDARASLLGGIDAKVRQRQGEGTMDYHVQSGSVHDLVVGGHPAASFVAEFTAADGTPEAEFMLRVLGEKTKAHFFLTMANGTDFRALLERLAPLMVTLNVQ